MRHTLQMKFLIFGVIGFSLIVGCSTVQILQYRTITRASNRVATYDVAIDDSSRLREEVIRLVARIKDVWLRGGKTDSVDSTADTAEQSWQLIDTLRARIDIDLALTPAMRDQLKLYDDSMADYRISYLQALARYRVELAQPDAANADARADSALKGKGLAASGLLGGFQDEVHAATAQLRVDREASVATARKVTIAETALLLLIIVSVGLWLVRTIGRGVGDVALAAVALGSGARDVQVPVRGKGELAQLGHAFNAMVKVLDTQEQQLEELRRIAVALTQATTERAVCEIVVNGLADTFGYHYVSIYLIRPQDPENLSLIAQRGYATVIDPIPVQGTVTGRTVRKRRPVLVTDASRDEDFIAAEHQIVCEACAPILTPARVLGTILLEEETVGRLTETDLNLIITLANNVSVALENIRLNVEARAQIDNLARVNRDLAAANTLKSEFLATMSHELRTPLNAIIGFSELLADGLVAEPDEVSECLTDILSSGRHLLSLINDVLDISKIEAGRMELKRVAFDLREEVGEVCRSVSPLVAARRHTLIVEEPPVPAIALADRQRIRQIVLNLVSNAIKFTPDGGTIRIAITCEGEKPSLLRLAIQDSGIGIRAEDFPKLFEKFRQLDGSHNRRYEGTGLGLALTKQLVELNGGTIAVISNFGHGSTFAFTVPAADAQPVALAPAESIAVPAD
ncbi:MAG: ATP-binding protein [Thermomicrobiales bacterium]